MPTAKEVDSESGGDGGGGDDHDAGSNDDSNRSNADEEDEEEPEVTRTDDDAPDADDDNSEKKDDDMDELEEASVTVEDESMEVDKNSDDEGGEAADGDAAASGGGEAEGGETQGAAFADGEKSDAEKEAEADPAVERNEDDAELLRKASANSGGVAEKTAKEAEASAAEGGDGGEKPPAAPAAGADNDAATSAAAVAAAAAAAITPNDKAVVDDNEPLSPPAWSDVSHDKMVRYPKSSLRAQSYFDLQQIRAIKPVTLLAMGIGIKKFPELEDDPIVKLAVQRTKFQLYHPTDVMTSKGRCKPFLQKEVIRRAILHNLNAMSAVETLGPDPCHDDIPRGNMERSKDKMRTGIPTYLPKPGNYTLQQCRDWLRANPPPLIEHQFLLKSVAAWRQQVRDQIANIEPRTNPIKNALAKYEEEMAKSSEESSSDDDDDRTKRSSAERVAAASAAAPTRDITRGERASIQAAARAGGPPGMNLQTAFASYQNGQFPARVPPPPPPHSFGYNPAQPHPPPPGPPGAHPGTLPQTMVPTPRGQYVPYATQLATAANLNTIQAQAINQYHGQIASLQAQLTEAQSKSATEHSMGTQFEIRVEKDTFKFNASHFVAFPGFRERLHGHSYRAAVKLIGNHKIGRDGYVLDFGCVKTVVKDVCKRMNEHFLVPTLSEVLKITVVDDEGDGVCGECVVNEETGELEKRTRKRKRTKYPGSVTIECEDGSTFVFPRQDCLLLPIMHSTAEELAIYLYGKILERLDSGYLLDRGVRAMEITVAEATGQDATFRREIPGPDAGDGEFDVARYVSMEPIPVMPCSTDTESAEGARMPKRQKTRNLEV